MAMDVYFVLQVQMKGFPQDLSFCFLNEMTRSSPTWFEKKKKLCTISSGLACLFYHYGIVWAYKLIQQMIL